LKKKVKKSIFFKVFNFFHKKVKNFEKNLFFTFFFKQKESPLAVLFNTLTFNLTYTLKLLSFFLVFSNMHTFCE